jgi:hypothetical protein
LDAEGLDVGEDRFFYWPLVGRVLVPEEQTLTPGPELLAFAQEKDVYPCDDPKNLIWGFVRYSPKEGVAQVKTTTIQRLKAMDAETREQLVQLHLQAYQRLPSHEERMAEIEAAKAASP